MRRMVKMLLAGALLASCLTIAGGQPAAQAAEGDCQISAPDPAFSEQVATSAGHARVWRLYQAFFLRQPDQEGLAHWFGVRARGASLSDIAYWFSTSAEFQQRYGTLTDVQFVDLVYRNVLCRTPDTRGRIHWTTLLTTGEMTRWDMVIAFVELSEFLSRTGTCHSIHPGENDALDACRPPALRPLADATMAEDGYQGQHVVVPRVAGGTGSFRGVLVDFSRGVFSTGADRCSVASINANWVVDAQKNGPDPSSVGLGVVDGRHVKGSADRPDRGILGLRFDATPQDVVEAWHGGTPTDDDQRLSSVWHTRGTVVLESWLSAAERSPYLDQHPEHRVGPDEWVWAASTAPLIIGGQKNKNFDGDYVRDPYSMQTLRHPFVAFDQDRGWLLFGATTTLDTRDLVVWAQDNGWEELVKFDGGASVEMNVGGQRVVGGTTRDLPVWLGIGC